jgi:hypothetical protein
MKHFIIYLVLLFICIFIFLLYFYKNYNETFIEFDSNNKPNFVVNYEKIDFKKEPNYEYENITQYNFDRLFKKIQRVNKEKISLEGKQNYNFYTQSTTDDKLRMNLDMITKYVLLVLNNDTYYDFSKTNFGDVEVWIDKEGNEEIKYELFLWDKKNYFEIKLWVYIIKFVDGVVDKYGIKDTHYMFPDFNIGWPFKDQIVPLPTDTVTPGNFDTSLNSIDPNNPSKIKYLYLNQIEIQNSTLIVDYHKDKYPFDKLTVDENGFSGITDQSLEYAVMKNNVKHNPYFDNARKYNEWPTLDSELKFYPQYPNVQPPQKWTDEGIYYYDNELKDIDNTENKNDEIKYTNLDNVYKNDKCDIYHAGTRWSEAKEPLQGQFWPSNYVLPKCGENQWLFNNLLGNSNTGSVFFGGGKM